MPLMSAVVPMSGRPLREDEHMLDAHDLEEVRAEICSSGPASDGDNLLGMEMDSFVYLNRTSAEGDQALWQDMRVHRSEGTDWLITGRATGRASDSAAISSELSRIWEQHLRYNYRSEHTLISAPEAVTLRAVTQIGPGDIWVTADIQVALI
jgi:hypothetical protein